MTTSRSEKPAPEPKRTLFGIAQDIREAIDDSAGEITPKLEALQLSIEQKVEGYAVVRREKKRAIVSLSELVDVYKARIAQVESEIEQLDEHLDAGMQLCGVQSIKTPIAHAFYKTTEAVELDEVAFREAYPPEKHPEMWRIKTEEKPNRAEVHGLLAEKLLVVGATLRINKHIQLR